MGVTLGDYDHDGRLDLFITNFDDDYNTLYHNDGKGSFTDVSYAAKVAAVSLPYVGWGTWFFDYDNDGWSDLLVVNGHVYPQLPTYRQRNFVHHNNRDGTFTEVGEQLGAPFLEKRTGRGAAFGYGLPSPWPEAPLCRRSCGRGSSTETRRFRSQCCR